MISHQFSDESELPIFCITNSDSEQNYSQLENEAFGVKKFHQYLYGGSLSLITDHKPRVTILGPKESTPPLAAAHLQCWAIILLAYQYTIEFKKRDDHANADRLSCLPVNDHPGEEQDVQATCVYVGPIHMLFLSLLNSWKQLVNEILCAKKRQANCF